MNRIFEMNNEIRAQILSMRDEKYKDFQCQLMPTIDSRSVLGVRTPNLRAYAKRLKDSPRTETFLASLPHKYYEENNLHAFLIEQITDFSVCLEEVNRFLPYVDNWATCDSMRPKCFKNHTKELMEEIERWLLSEHTYTVRFGIVMLMVYYLDEHFDVRYLDMVANVKSEEYYVKMVIAWYFATALAKQWDSAISYIEDNRLPIWVHNKTIQKAVESYRITDEQKVYLKRLKRKGQS